MPPQSPIQNQSEEKLLPPGRASSSGPVVGIIIIIVLLILGGLYFWGAHLNAQNNPENQLPLIPADNSTTTTY